MSTYFVESSQPLLHDVFLPFMRLAGEPKTKKIKKEKSTATILYRKRRRQGCLQRWWRLASTWRGWTSKTQQKMDRLLSLSLKQKCRIKCRTCHVRQKEVRSLPPVAHDIIGADDAFCKHANTGENQPQIM
jgi:hypothetical protein